MTPQMNPGGLTDDELLRLAKLLQQTRGEGLAFINPGEAQMLRDAGGSGQPIPGTQGFGVGGGPIRSYVELTDTTTEEAKEAGLGNEPKPDQGAFETRPEVIVNRPTSSDGGSDSQPVYTPPPPKYYDKLGREYSSQAEADAADERIDAQRAKLDTAFNNLTTDQEYDTLKLQNPDLFAFDDLPEDEVRKKFDEQKILAYEESKLQTKNYSDQISGFLRTKGTDADGNPIPMTQQDLVNLQWDDIKDQVGDYSRLSEDTQRTIFESMLATGLREARFTLTLAEVEDFAREAIQATPVAGVGEKVPVLNEDGTQKVDADGNPVFRTPIKKPEISEITSASNIDVGMQEVPDLDENGVQKRNAKGQLLFKKVPVDIDPERVVVGRKTVTDEGGNEVLQDEVFEINRTKLDALDGVIAGEDKLVDILKKRVTGEATSPAELQLKRATEDNLKLLLGSTAGTADPAKLRQLRNIFAETSQVLSGQAAELRSREQIDAENRLVQLYKQQGDRELQIAMVNLETKKQVAFKQADLDQVRNLSIQQANLQRVITKANLDRDVELANLDTRRQKALSQGQIDVAVALANLEKDITLSKLNAELALRSRALDDALALANYQGEMALEGIEVKIDLAEMEADVRTKLAELGVDSAEKIAQLNADTQLAIANLNASAARAASGSQERAAIIGAIGTIVAGAITASDYRLKTDINELQVEESLSLEQIDELLTVLTPYTFQYKDQTYGAGKRFGIMAQDLEKSDVGKQFVIDTPVGKMVDFGNMMGLIVASQAYLHECSVR